MTRTYPIRGSERPAIAAPHTSPDVAITRLRRVLPGSARDAGVGEIAARGDEVVRAELENGFMLWTRAGDLIRERGRNTPGRAAGGESREIGLRPRFGKPGGKTAAWAAIWRISC